MVECLPSVYEALIGSLPQKSKGERKPHFNFKPQLIFVNQQVLQEIKAD